MELINNIARAAVHSAIEKMFTPEKIEEVVEVVCLKLQEEKLIENTTRSVLMTARAGILEMTSKPDPVEVPK